MKKLLLMTVFALCTLTMHAQTGKGDMAAGLNLSLGTGDSFTNIGIGAKFQWNVINNLRLEPSFNYYFKKDHVSMWDLSANVHYLFGISDKFILYPLAGLGVLGVKASWDNPYGDLLEDWGVEPSYSSSSTNFAFNIGGGAEYKVTSAISVGLEIKYKIASNWNRALFTLGAAYHF